MISDFNDITPIALKKAIGVMMIHDFILIS